MSKSDEALCDFVWQLSFLFSPRALLHCRA